jgi:magnesium chelatase family protein
LEALRQPLETGRVAIARANTHVTYPARVQLVAAMNPCRCGYLDDPALACPRAPRCALEYQSKISGPLFDRIDLHVEVPAVHAGDLSLPPPAEGSAEIAARVAAARARQAARYAAAEKGQGPTGSAPRTNAEVDGALLEELAAPDAEGRRLLTEAAERMKLTARGYHRVLKVARTLADLDAAEGVGRIHIAEALSYRRLAPGRF